MDRDPESLIRKSKAVHASKAKKSYSYLAIDRQADVPGKQGLPIQQFLGMKNAITVNVAPSSSFP